MPSNNITDFLGKIDELRAVFILGQRAVPFLEDLFGFLQEIMPLMEEIDHSLRESTQSMPHATSQLQSVSEATELATTEVLDLIDAAFMAIGRTQAQTGEHLDNVEALRRTDARLIRLLRDELREKDPVLLERVEFLHKEKLKLRRRLDERLREQNDALKEIRNMLNRIMISQQVQDITTQQLASVNHLIESIRDKMSQLVQRLSHDGLSGDLAAPLTAPKRSTFDPHARYDTSGNRQVTADEVVAAFSPEEPAGPASQDDIDALFGAPRGDGASETASQDDIDDLFGHPPAAASRKDAPAEPAPKPASQDDIDALFGGGPASQDDIDKLFGS